MQWLAAPARQDEKQSSFSTRVRWLAQLHQKAVAGKPQVHYSLGLDLLQKSRGRVRGTLVPTKQGQAPSLASAPERSGWPLPQDKASTKSIFST